MIDSYEQATAYANPTVAAYIIEFHRGSPSVAAQHLSRLMGSQYSAQHVMDWRNGQRGCPRKVMDHMRAKIIRHYAWFADEEQENQVLELLSLEAE